jgi:prepilin-type N-terminal cleavage/methylation domain-containing protein
VKRPAFTLIELIVVTALIAFIVAFITPTYQLIISQLQLSEAATQVGDFLLLTQQKTVTEQLIYGVTLTAGATSIPQYTYVVNPDGSVTKTPQTTFALPINISISQVNFSGQSDVRFSTSAAPNISGDIVVIDSVRGRKKRITITPSGSINANQTEF